jgi:hypothetical protein
MTVTLTIIEMVDGPQISVMHECFTLMSFYNIGYTRRRKTKQRHNTICVEHHYTQISTNNVNKTCTILQITGSKDEPNIVTCSQRHLNYLAFKTVDY